MSHFTINSKERTTTHIVQQIHAVPYTYISFRTYCKASLFKQNYVTFVISVVTTSSHGILVLDVKQIKPLHFLFRTQLFMSCCFNALPIVKCSPGMKFNISDLCWYFSNEKQKK